MPSLFCTPTYSSRFITVQYLSPEWGVKLVEWIAGKPQGHAWLPTMFEAVGWCLEQGLTLANPQMQTQFELDVIDG